MATRRQLARKGARLVGVRQDAATVIVNSFLAGFIDTLAKDRRVEIRGIGTFTCKKTILKNLRNLKTGQNLPEREVMRVKFKPASVLLRHLEKIVVK